MFEQWRPTKSELAVGGLTLVILPAANVGKNLYDGDPFWLIVLTTLGIMVLLLLLIICWVYIRGPRGYANLSDQQLIHGTIDKWMQRQRFGRREGDQRPSYSETLIVSHGDGDATVQVGKKAGRDAIDIWGVLSWAQGQYNLDAMAWSNIQFDIALEMARFGVFSRFIDLPNKQIVFWVELPVSGIDERAIDLAVDLVRRSDSFIRILWAKQTTAVAISAQLGASTAATPLLSTPE